MTLKYRKHGIGSKLVKKSFECARELGYKVVFVVGDPAFYGRFGFKTSALFGIKHVPLVLEHYIMLYELYPDALTGIAGNVTFT